MTADDLGIRADRVRDPAIIAIAAALAGVAYDDEIEVYRDEETWWAVLADDGPLGNIEAEGAWPLAVSP